MRGSFLFMNEEIDYTEEYFFKKDFTFILQKGYLFSFLLSVGWFGLHSLALRFIHHEWTFIESALDKSFFHIEFLLPVLFGGLILQEAIKSIILNMFGKVKWTAMKAGFSIHTLMPYIESKYPIPIGVYRWLLIVPTFLLLQFVWLSYCCSYSEWLVFTSIWLFFSGFDILAYFQIRRLSTHYLAATHDKLPGVIVYENPFNEEI